MDNAYARYPSLSERVVIVTGGGSGIGASLVEHFCHQQAKVTFFDIKEDVSEALVERLTKRGSTPPRFVRVDLTDTPALQAAIARTASDVGPVRVLVNNVANDDRHALDDVTPAYWENRMAVNLRHHVFAVQAARPSMRDAGGGSIVSMGSISWRISQGEYIGYVTAKAAIEGLTRGLARELGSEFIRSNCVLPGWVMTERQKRLWLDAQGEREIERNQCLPGRLEPADVSRLVLWLAADDSRMCTAQSWIVDAGWT